jgi:hypothetical protein
MNFVDRDIGLSSNGTRRINNPYSGDFGNSTIYNVNGRKIWNCNPKPVIRAMVIAAPEVSVPNNNLTIVGAMINRSPVRASSLEATE